LLPLISNPLTAFIFHMCVLIFHSVRRAGALPHALQLKEVGLWSLICKK
jgi:hypothetical protein